jgi:hypothetical protein
VRFAALFATAVVAASVALPADARAQQGVAWGAFTPGAPESRSAIDAFNAKTGRRAAIWHTYKNWDWEPFHYDTVGRTHEAGAVPLITWEPHGRPLRAISRGDYDGYIRAAARQGAAFGKPILLRFAHEMNGDWYSWGLGVGGNTAGDYVSAYRHVVRIFRAENADNVKHVWGPNTGTFGSLYPGDDFVDYLALDGYNWGAKYNTWESFEQVFDSSYRAITQLSRKPLLITEFGANQAGGDKAAWLRHALAPSTLSRYPRIRAMVFFDNNQDGADWRLSTSSASEAAVRNALNHSMYDLDAAGLVRLSGSSEPEPVAPARPDPPASPPAGGGMRCGIYPRSTLRMSRMWTVNVPIRCDRAGSDRCYGLVKIKHVGTRRTLGTAEVELWAGRRNPVRIGLPGWARTALVRHWNVATRVTMRVGGGCRTAAGRRVTIRR